MRRRLLAVLATLILAVGLKLPPPPSHTLATLSRHALGLCYITGYTWTGFRTATGTWPAVGRTVAVDPQVIPLGSRVHIAGLGWRRAEDTGGAVWGCHVDVFVGSLAQAYAITRYRRVSWTR